MRALIILLLLTGVAHAEPSNERLFYTGLALAPPDYLLGVALHEGSHALAAELLGADVLEVHLFPPGRDPKVNKFRFGWTYVRGLKTRGQRIAFYLAPKVTDALLFTAAVLPSPNNRYGQLALTVFATGLWIDFSKDVFLFSDTNDVTRAFHQWCMYGWKQIAPRALYAGLIGVSGYFLYRTYQKTFTDETSAVSIPIVALRF
jgi:hypothetical protein